MALLFKNLESIILYTCLLGVGLIRISVAVGNIFFVASLLLFVFWCYKEKVNTYKKIQERVSKNVLLAYVLFLACFLPSILLSDNSLEGIKQLLEMFVFRLMPFVIVVVVANSKKILEGLLIGFMVIEIADCCVALYQSFVLGIYNAWGFGFWYLNLAGLLACIVPIAAVLALDEFFSHRVRIVAGIAFIIMLLCAIAGTKSRALWLLMLSLMPIIAICYRKVLFQNKIAMTTVLATLVLSVSFFLASDKNLQRLESVANTKTNNSNIARIYMWKSCLKMMEDYPVTGVGLGNYNRYYREYYEMAAVPEKGFGHPHNSYLHLGSQAGLPGLMAVVFATLGIIGMSLKKWMQKACVYYYLLGMSWLGFSLFGMIEPIIDSTVHAKIISFLSGIFCVGLYLEEKGKENGDE